MLEHCNIPSTKVNQAPRAAAAIMSEAAGVDEGQIRRCGRWNSDAMSSSYLTNIPRQAMRCLAGFNKNQTALFWPRNSVLPSLELQAQVFPGLNYWLNEEGVYFGFNT
jgi:Centromere DNA-binding protein complex CBF3 subunit, domain 2